MEYGEKWVDKKIGERTYEALEQIDSEGIDTTPAQNQSPPAITEFYFASAPAFQKHKEMNQKQTVDEILGCRRKLVFLTINSAIKK